MPAIRLNKLWMFVVLGLGIGLHCIPHAVAAPYSYVNLGSLGGVITDLNDSGQVVGYSLTADNVQRGFITASNGRNLMDLGTLGGTTSRAYGINEAGRVEGVSDISGNSARYAFITSASDQDMASLGDLGGGGSGAYSINAACQVVGWSYDMIHILNRRLLWYPPWLRYTSNLQFHVQTGLNILTVLNVRSAGMYRGACKELRS